MDTTSQAKFEELIDLDIDSMSREELEFLMARRSYMNAVQTERFAKTIKLHEEGKLFGKKSAPAEESEEGADEDGEEGEEAPVAKKKVAKRK